MGTTMDCGPAARELLARLSTPTRNRYYYGKLLDAHHLELEQDYGNRKRWLLNRLSLGTGVLCGLRVQRTEDGRQVRVGPGVAIDAWGREIVVERPSSGVDPRQPTDDCGAPIGPPVRERGRVTLWICYHECEAEPAPVMVSDCERSCENGLIRERYRLRVTAGAPRPPGIVTPEQCTAIFSAAPDEAARRRTAAEVLAGLCAEPEESCVPLAVLELDADGRVGPIDPISVRPVLYSNAVLLDLILCLAERVDECCPPQAVKSLRIVSGDNQEADAGQRVGEALVVRVTESGNPVQGEQVTFRVQSGDGRIGDGGALDQDFQVATEADGTAKLPVWELGPIAGPQRVTAEIAAGTPDRVTFTALAREVRVDLPVIRMIWPLPAAGLSDRDPDTRLWLAEFQKVPRIELVFSHKMRQAQLDRPDEWLRLFLVTGQRNEFIVRRFGLRHATAAEAGAIPAVLHLTPGEREVFLIETRRDAAEGGPTGPQPVPTHQPAATGGRPEMTFGTRAFLRAAMVPATIAASAARQVRVLVLAKADPADRRIEDRRTPPRLLDADYAGTMLQQLPGSSGSLTLWDDVWNLPLGTPATPPVFGQSLWNAMTTTADVLPSGNQVEGGRFDSWFGIELG